MTLLMVSKVFFSSLVIYMTRAGETGLSWIAMFSLYVFYSSLLLCRVLFVYVSSVSFYLADRL